jgi:hypothetical protein
MAKGAHLAQHKKEIDQNAFLDAYKEMGNISRASTASNIDRRSHYRWLENDEAYAENFAEAEKEAIEKLEAEARRRASEGYEEPVFYKGEVCGTVRKYSDVLLMFLLKGLKPDMYKDRTHTEISGNVTIGLAEKLRTARERVEENK